MTQVTHVDTTGLGNTNSKPVRERARRFCFTLNNYTSEEYDTLTQVFLEKKWCYIIGKEVGENGTPHLQGYLQCKNAISFNTLKKIIPRAHIEQARGTEEENFAYCSKENNFITNIEIKPNYLDQYEDEMNETYNEVKWQGWQQDILNLIETKPSSRTVHWFWEEEGNKGKSFLCRYIDWKYNAIIANGKQADVFNQYKCFLEEYKTQPKVAIIDIPRSHQDYVCYSTLEKIKDGLIYSGKYEGGKLRLCKHHLIIFANFAPDRSKLSDDRWDIREIS